MTGLLQVNFHEAVRSLWGARQRSLLALIGIVIGIGSVIGMVSIGTIVQQEAIRQFKDLGIDIISIRKSGGGGERTDVSPETFLRITEERRGVVDIAPYVESSTEFARGRKKMFMPQLGVTASFFALNKLHVRQGRIISELDRHRFFCVVGAELADFLRKTGTQEMLGSRISVNDRAYTVIGVLDPVVEGGLRPFGMNRAMMVPLSTALRTFQSAEIRAAMARVAPQVPIDRVKAEVQEYFSKAGRGMQVQVSSAEEMIAQMKKQMQMFSLLLGAIGSIALVVGGIGVMNIMLISIAERRSEIGLRRALGAQQSDIQSQFLSESVILCLAGGLVGIAVGIGVSYLFAYFTKWAFVMSYSSIALGVGVSTAVGLFCGFYPARTAAKLDPIKALRS